MTTRLRTLAAGGALIVALATFPTSPARADTTTIPHARCDLVPHNDSARWVGQPTPEMNDLATRLENLVATHPDVFAGTEYCRDYTAVALLYATSYKQESEELIAAHFATRAKNIDAVAVPASRADLYAARDAVIDQMKTLEAFQSVTIDATRGAAVVAYGDPTSTFGTPSSPSAEPPRTIGTVRVESQKSNAGPARPANRDNDSSPWFGGSWVTPSASVTAGGYCSTAFSGSLDGRDLMVTAGHCEGSPFYHRGRHVGNTYTTSWKGTTSSYGDFKLLSGSTYAPSVWSGGPTSGASLAVTGANWGQMTRGTQACTSGFKTGQKCRYYVVDPDTGINMGGTTVNMVTRFRYDPGQTGDTVPGGFIPGDSGGSCYYSGGGGVIAYGIISAFDTHSATDSTPTGIYYCSRIEGIRKWNARVQIP